MPLPSMYGWRITKYNPAFRDERGAYLKDEWTSVSDVGKSFGDEVLPSRSIAKLKTPMLQVLYGFLRMLDSIR